MFQHMFKNPRGRHHFGYDPRYQQDDTGDREDAFSALMDAEWHHQAMQHVFHRPHGPFPWGRHPMMHEVMSWGDGPSRGGPGGMFDGRGMGGRGGPSFVRGRKFGAEELQILLLSLLKNQASYGYELIKLLGERSGGFYTPSPGVIYPAMSYMEDVGYVTVQQEGTRKRYAIAPEGEQWLAQNQSLADALLAKLDMFARQSESFNQAMREQRQAFAPALMEAMHALRTELHDWHGSSEAEQQQIADILQQTLAQLRALKETQ